MHFVRGKAYSGDAGGRDWLISELYEATLHRIPHHHRDRIDSMLCGKRGDARVLKQLDAGRRGNQDGMVEIAAVANQRLG